MIAAWEIHATDPGATAAFYGDILGWTTEARNLMGTDYLHIHTPEGQATGRIIPRHGEGPSTGAPVMGCVATFAVDDLDAAVSAFKEKNALEALPPFDIPGEGRAAYFLDPDNNVFGIFERQS